MFEFSLFCFTVNFVCIEVLCSDFRVFFFFYISHWMRAIQFNETHCGSTFWWFNANVFFYIPVLPFAIESISGLVCGAHSNCGVLSTSLVQPAGTGYELKEILQSAPRRALCDQKLIFTNTSVCYPHLPWASMSSGAPVHIWKCNFSIVHNGALLILSKVQFTCIFSSC